MAEPGARPDPAAAGPGASRTAAPAAPARPGIAARAATAAAFARRAGAPPPPRTGWLGRLSRLRGARAELAALGLGALSALALPPIGAVPVLLLVLPGLFVLAEGARDWRVALRRGFLFGFAHHVLGLYWITSAILIMAAQFWWFVPLAVPMLAAWMAVFVALPCALMRMGAPGWRRVLLFAGWWVLFDIARQFALTGFPWNPLGSVWALPGWLGDAMIQPAAAVGVHGLTLATVLLALTPVLGRRYVAAGAVVLAGWLSVGAARLAGAVPGAPALEVVLVQGNVAEGAKQDRAAAVAIFEHDLDLTRAGVAKALAAPDARPLVVIWPETAFPGLLDQDPAARAAIVAAGRPTDMAAGRPTDMAAGRPAGGRAAVVASLIGSVRFDPAGRPRNSLMSVAPDGGIVATYDKAHLVPFGEYQPGWLPIVQIVPGGGFASGPGPRTQHVAGVPPFGPLICYETIFPAQVVDQTDRPAWMTEVTNDAWFGNGTGPRQHLAAGRLRAVEEGLPLVRAANTGISAVIDARGHEVARLGMDVAGTLVAPLPPALAPTPFARLGLAIPLLLGFAACGFGLGLGRRRVAEGTGRRDPEGATSKK